MLAPGPGLALSLYRCPLMAHQICLKVPDGLLERDFGEQVGSNLMRREEKRGEGQRK
jgi:hypothetical protein